MVIYQDVLDIPAEVLAQGGTWEVYGGVPAGIVPGQGFAAIEEGAAMAAGLGDQLLRGDDGEIIRVAGSIYNPQPGYSIFASSPPEENPQFWAGVMLVLVTIGAVIAAHFVGFMVFIVLLAALVVGAYAIKKLTAPRFGEIIKENPDGSSVFQSTDGSIYLLNPDGSYEKIQGPSETGFGDLENIIKWSVAGVVGIGLLYVGVQAYSAHANKKPFTVPLFDSTANLATKAVNRAGGMIG